MSATSDHALREAMAITAAMREAARTGDWVLVAELEVTRVGFLRAAAAAADSDPVQWQALLAANTALVALLSERREALALEWAASRKTQMALRDYDRIGRAAEGA